MSKFVMVLGLLGWALPAGQAQDASTVTSATHDTGVRVENSTRKLARPRTSLAKVQLQVEQIQIEMQRQHADMQQQILDLKEQLNESRRQIALTQSNRGSAVEAAKSLSLTTKEPHPLNNQPVANLQAAVSDLKVTTVSLAATVAENQAKINSAIENPVNLHYKALTLTPGGFLAAEGAWRQRMLQADIASPFNSIPWGGSALANLTEFRLSARQSRMNLLAESKIGTANVVGFIEFDLLGAGLTSNSTESNSYMPRLRHAWMQSSWGNGWTLAAGQMWTLANASRKGISAVAGNAYLPDMIDAQYVVGLNWLRQPSVRIVKDFGDRIWIAASAEGAQTTFSARNAPSDYLFGSAGTSTMSSIVNYSFDKAPDLLVKIAVEPGFGHYELKGLARFFRDRVYPGNPSSAIEAYNDNRLGGGIGAAASWSFLKKVDFSLNSLLGDGIGRYGTSQLPDLTVRPDGTLAPIRGAQGLGTLEFSPNSRLKLYSYGGIEYAGRRPFLNSKDQGEGYGSPLNINTGCETEAVSIASTSPTAGACAADTRSISQGVLGFWYKPYIGPMGRIQYGMQYSYTERSAWSGVGGAPKGNENMVFTSMRFYLP